MTNHATFASIHVASFLTCVTAVALAGCALGTDGYDDGAEPDSIQTEQGLIIASTRKVMCGKRLYDMRVLLDDAIRSADGNCVTNWAQIDDMRRDIEDVNYDLRSCNRTKDLSASQISAWVEQLSRFSYLKSSCVENLNKRFCGQQVEWLETFFSAATQSFQDGCTDVAWPENMGSYYMALARVDPDRGGTCQPQNWALADEYVDALTNYLETVQAPYCNAKEKIQARCPMVRGFKIVMDWESAACFDVEQTIDYDVHWCASRWDVAECLDYFGYTKIHLEKTFCDKTLDIDISICLYPDGEVAGGAGHLEQL